MPEQDEYFDQGPRGSSLSFTDPSRMNVWRGGLVLSCNQRQAVEHSTGKPKFWKDKDGVPTDRKILTRIITLYCLEEIDPNSPKGLDTGVRAVWIEDGGLRYPKDHRTMAGQERHGSKFFEYVEAMKRAGVPGTLPESGGVFYICWTGERPGRGTIDEKTWKFDYRRPTAESLAHLAGIMGELGLSEAATQPPADAYAPASAPTPAPQPPFVHAAPAQPVEPPYRPDSATGQYATMRSDQPVTASAAPVGPSAPPSHPYAR